MKRLAASLILIGITFFVCGFGELPPPSEEGAALRGRTSIDVAVKIPLASRAMWVWDKGGTVEDLLLYQEDREELFAFCKNPHDGGGVPIHTLYLDGHQYPEEYAEKMARFLSEAHEEGLEVHYLGGDPSWVKISPEKVLTKVRMVLDHNKKYGVGRGFDGIHFDVEPYLLSDWKIKREEITRTYLSLLRQIKGEIDRSGQRIKFGVAVPVFFSEEDPTGRILSDEVLKIVDYMAVMDYRDKWERIVKEGEPMVKAANRLGKKVVIGIETLDVVGVGEGVDYYTFHEEGWHYMETQLAKVEEAFAGESSYRGIAIHYYNSYHDLQEENIKGVVEVPEVKMGRAQRVVKVDGDSGEWVGVAAIKVDKEENVVHTLDRKWQGPDDLSALVFTQWGRENLYFLIKVKDDRLVVTPQGKGANMWIDDHAEIWIAPDIDYDSGLEKKYQIGVSPGNFSDIKPSSYIWVPDGIPPEVMARIKVGAKKTAAGYNLEVAIPFTVLEGLTPERGTVIRLDVEPSDTDTAGKKQEILMALSTARKWGDPSTFAILRFE